LKRKQGKPQTTENLPAETPEQTQDETKALTAPKGIPIEDLIEYRKKGLTCEEIGRLTGCDHSNVARRLKDVALDSLDNFRTNKDTAFEHIQQRTLKNITDAEIKRLNPLQRVTAAAILQDKIQVIRGQATEIVDHRVLVVDLAASIRAMRAEQGQSGGDEQDTECSTIEIPVDNCPPPPK